MQPARERRVDGGLGDEFDVMLETSMKIVRRNRIERKGELGNEGFLHTVESCGKSKIASHTKSKRDSLYK